LHKSPKHREKKRIQKTFVYLGPIPTRKERGGGEEGGRRKSRRRRRKRKFYAPRYGLLAGKLLGLVPVHLFSRLW
jgi:hypothetical protein